MRIGIAAVLTVALAVLVTFAASSDADKKELEAWARSLDKESIHKAVLDHERDPLGDNATKIRPVLVIHFEPLDYDVCLDQIGFLLHSRNKAHHAIFWQVVFGSGDFVEQHPDRAGDKSAYMLAGLESGLRAYERVLVSKPKVRLAEMDELLSLRDAGRLVEFVKAKPCDKS